MKHVKAKIRLILAAAVIGLIGCAAGRNVGVGHKAPPDPAPEAGARPNAKAGMALDDIEPRVAMPPGTGSSIGQPPLAAVHLYAEARAAVLDRDRATAIDLLQQAVALDPLSYELHVTLGRLYLTPTIGFSDRSIAMLEKAAALEPDHLDLQTDLARQYLEKGNATAAITHFRMALLTRQCKADPTSAAVAEYFLGKLLRKEGYLSAALEVYQRLSAHLKSAEIASRRNPEVTPLLKRADEIDAEIAELLVVVGRFPEAIVAYAALVAQDPGNFELRKQQVHLLLTAGHPDQALAAAEAAAVRFRADSDSLALLDEASRAAGFNDGAAGALARLHKARPGDHGILYALADLLHNENHDVDAQRLLSDAAAADPGDFEVLRRRVAIALHGNDRISAARLLVHASAAAPDISSRTATLWNVLDRPTSHGRLRWADLKTLEVPKADEQARWYWVSHLAAAAHRLDVAQESLAKAGDFVPAFRDRLNETWNRDDLSVEAKTDLTRKIATEAGAAGGESLAEEIRALGFERAGDIKAAAASFAHAMELGGRSADLLLARADVLRKTEDDLTADSLLWKLISDYPSLDDAYIDLYLASIRRGVEVQAEHVLNVWLAAEPDSVNAWRSQALQYQREGHVDAAEGVFLRLFSEHGEDPEAVGALGSFLVRRHHADRYLALLQDRHAHDPGNFAVSAALAQSLAAAQRGDEAVRVVDSARSAAGDDADLLYTISGLYLRTGGKQGSEEALKQVLKLDPSHPAAANDLGYAWAEEGRNLPEAEALIRQAVKSEPQNISFLDSMGWVLYKRGKFAEARQFMDRAIGGKDSVRLLRSDPVMLEHRGDILYRLGDKDAAESDWKGAADGVAARQDNVDSDMKSLQERVLEKSRRLKAGQSVPVAPIAEK